MYCLTLVCIVVYACVVAYYVIVICMLAVYNVQLCHCQLVVITAIDVRELNNIFLNLTRD